MTSLGVCNVVLDIFFHEIRLCNAHHIPVEGPIIFIAAPHSNQPSVSMIQLLTIKTDSFCIMGLNMCFTTQLHMGDSISLPKGLVLFSTCLSLSSSMSLVPRKLEALTGSMIKIASHDILATWKLLISLAFIPALYTTYILITLFIALCSDWPRSIKLLTPLLIWNLLPFISYISMRFGENRIDVYRYVILS
ncbi:hypothetical protein BC936DRAFT_139313 [Jimgerdemannia flammicorona]|uniref:Uncharacterized protein n=1 Tax=Jimgerdemannia flammicorona TaxID=994334 RepID=A0A433BA51_9FUNG|nr:hypothetical protein BC936DRAFT_139313 [Jimgerdemannia flammicorona]